MLPVCRLGDIGVGNCPCHGGIPIIGNVIGTSPNKQTNSIPNALLGNMVICSCGHVAIIAIGSLKSFTNTLPQPRVTDIFIGCPIGTLVVGSFNSLTL